MDEYDEYSWNCGSDAVPAYHRWSFSLAALLRVIALVGLALGWLRLVPTMPPPFVQLSLVALGAVLAAVVGWRRFGTLATRFKTAAWFLAGSVLVALYSGCVANVIQTLVTSTHPWAGLDRVFHGVAVLAGFPVILVILVFMLRAWTWSAHDRLIHKRR